MACAQIKPALFFYENEWPGNRDAAAHVSRRVTPYFFAAVHAAFRLTAFDRPPDGLGAIKCR